MIANAVDGAMRVEDGVGVVRVSSVYETSIDDLWAAVTDPERLARWFGDIRAADPDSSLFEAALTTGWAGELRVIDCDAPRRLRATLRDAMEQTEVVATLEQLDGGVRLTIEERGLPVGDLATYVAGWHAQIEQLEAILSGGRDVDWKPRWEQLRAAYAR